MKKIFAIENVIIEAGKLLPLCNRIARWCAMMAVAICGMYTCSDNNGIANGRNGNGKAGNRILLVGRIYFEDNPLKNCWCIFTIDPDGSNLRRLTSNDYEFLYARWSPDGTHILAYGGPTSGGLHDREGIWLLDAEGNVLERLFYRGGSGVWSPDGSRVAFPGTGLGNLYFMDLNTDETEHIPTGIPGLWLGDWSETMDELLFVSHWLSQGDKGKMLSDVFTMDTTGTITGRITDDSTASTYEPRWSPDETRISFLERHIWSDHPNKLTFVILDLVDSSRMEIPIDGWPASVYAWSPDGTQIAMAIHDYVNAPRARLYLVDIEKGSFTKIFESDSINVYATDWRWG